MAPFRQWTVIPYKKLGLAYAPSAGPLAHAPLIGPVLVSRPGFAGACTLSLGPNTHISFSPVRRDLPGEAVTVLVSHEFPARSWAPIQCDPRGFLDHGFDDGSGL